MKRSILLTTRVGHAQVKDGDSDHPQIGYSTPLLTLWQKPSARFETPKGVIYLSFACPEVQTHAS